LQGGGQIAEYEWTLSDGDRASGACVDRTYDEPGTYCEILKVTDRAGRTDYDFARVTVLDRKHPERWPIGVHPAYHPTRILEVGGKHSVDVFAGERWTRTGLYLEKGRSYRFSAICFPNTFSPWVKGIFSRDRASHLRPASRTSSRGGWNLRSRETSYRSMLRPGGILAVHVSNKYLDLPRVARAGALSAGLTPVRVDQEADPPTARDANTWVLAAGDPAFFSIPAFRDRVTPWGEDRPPVLWTGIPSKWRTASCWWRSCNMSQWISFISDRIGWEPYLKPFMYKELPSDIGWSATLGSLCVLVFAVEAVTGMLLAMYYSPTPELAYESIQYIMNEVTMGRILRGIHHWGAGAMVILVFMHMMTNFFAGSFKAPRELTWVVGVVLFLITLGLGLTGYLLPWDQKAYWATVVSSNIPRDIPLIGGFITRMLLAGDRVSGLTLTRFYSIHMLMLPGLMMLCMAFHIYLVRIHGMAEHPVSVTTGSKPSKNSEKKRYRFYPEHLFKSSIAFALVLAVILMLSIFAQVPLEKKVGTVDPSYLPRPEWYFMWLFQLLTFFSGAAEVAGSLAIPVGAVIVLFLLPWLSKTNLRSMADRPLATAVGVTCTLGIVYLTLMGFEGARSYGKIVPVPDRPLNILELKGLKLFVDRDCAYCHHIQGKGGRLQGPDLSNVIAKDRSAEWLIKFIKDPQSISRWTIMPKYGLDEPSLKELSAFILSLDFKTHDMKIISREEALSGRRY